MKQIIPFSKEIVFKTNIASITSISLEHEEKVSDGEINGDFIIFGDYKIHNDTTEKELFRYRLPFTAIIPDNVIKDSVVVDIDDFRYEQIDEDVLKVNISFSLEGEERPLEEKVIEEERKYEEELNTFLEQIDNKVDVKNDDSNELEDNIEENSEELEEREVIDNVKQEEKIKEDKNIDNGLHDEYITYHIHIVKEDETLDTIIRNYNVNLDYIKEYNDITNVQIGDKIIIPELVDE